MFLKLWISIHLIILIGTIVELRIFTLQERNFYKEKVKTMFYHAYNGYLRYAYPYDELRPLTCDGHDTWGCYSLTLIDALDTLVILGNYSEFKRVVHILENLLNFDQDINISVFETNIRVVGGLLSGHLLSRRAGLYLEPGWPCDGPLLRMAENVAKKLLPAFKTKTGMPFGTINLLHGVPLGETTVTCTAAIGTFVVEFGTLSKLTGNPIYIDTALKALKSLWRLRSSIGLVGNHIDVISGKWVATESSIGAGIDSYFEYLVKGSALFDNSDLMYMFLEYKKSIEKYLKRDDWYMWASMDNGVLTQPLFQSLESFWPGLLSLIGDYDEAIKSFHNYHQVWRQYGFMPEFYNIPKSEPHSGREAYPLRPELVESAMYLYQAKNDSFAMEVAVDILESIESISKTSCGYATIRNVKDHSLENRMESFFLAETIKYLYLIFDESNFLHNKGDHGYVVMTTRGECLVETGQYVFNTEAHPIDSAALLCCSPDQLSSSSQLDLEADLINEILNVDIWLEEIKSKPKYADNSYIPPNIQLHNKLATCPNIAPLIYMFSNCCLISKEDDDEFKRSINVKYNFIDCDNSSEYSGCLTDHIKKEKMDLLTCESEKFHTRFSVMGQMFIDDV